ncbi:MAG TPA: lipid kinase, partial [Pseudomonas sp.]|nr:lipid kinase [Pseudomonas sp.]
LARALDSVGLSEADVQVVNTSDADMVAVYGTDDVTSVATWNPLLSEISQQPNSTVVFDSAQIPGEVIDLLVINTDTLSAHPELGKALTGAWYEIMATMSSDSEQGVAARSYMAEASGTDLDGYEAQLAATKMFYTPAAALELTNSAQLKQTMQYVAEFSFDHGLLGDGAPDAGFIGVQMPAGDYGDSGNLKLRFDPTYMQMAADGQL